ncbi:MAG: hypothetical protein H0T79_09735 [Deltaproteobacteria bacterium]|nr:hypothetical protein [Deltaproteobacteria bacterium]
MLGVVLVFAGGVMLVVPGPGLLVIVFGLALLAGESKRLAHVLDRAELVVRRWVGAARRWWAGLTPRVKLALIANGVALVVLLGLVGFAAVRSLRS